MNRALQQRIARELEVTDAATFDAAEQVELRVGFLADYLKTTGAKGYVLGISGGVDSSLGGRLAQLACERVRASGGDATFIAMRLPYRVQADESDAQRALAFIKPDETLTVNIAPAVDGMWAQLTEAGLVVSTDKDDFVKGNVKARQRMIAQFTVAGARGMLVIGTDQAAEAVVGFFTKFGDGAADLTPSPACRSAASRSSPASWAPPNRSSRRCRPPTSKTTSPSSRTRSPWASGMRRSTTTSRDAP